MRKNKVILLLCFVYVGLTGQGNLPGDIGRGDIVRFGEFTPNAIELRDFDERYANRKGSPLLWETWQPGKVLLKKQEDYGPVMKVNLDLDLQVAFVLFSNGQIAGISAEHVAAVRFHPEREEESHFRVYPKRPDKGNGEPTFFQVLHEGDIIFLKFIWKHLLKADFKDPYGTGRTQEEFLTKAVYWVKGSAGNFSRIKFKRKDLEKALPAHKRQIRTMWERLPHDEAKEADLVELFEVLEKEK